MRLGKSTLGNADRDLRLLRLGIGGIGGCAPLFAGHRRVKLLLGEFLLGNQRTQTIAPRSRIALVAICSCFRAAAHVR